jgi:hypothetical protein
MSSHSGFLFPITHKNIEVILHTHAYPPLEHNNCNLVVSTFALLIAISDGWNVVVPH